jgi:hypothetical protein
LQDDDENKAVKQGQQRRKNDGESCGAEECECIQTNEYHGGDRRYYVCCIVTQLFRDAEQQRIVDRQRSANEDVLERVEATLLGDFHQEERYEREEIDEYSIFGGSHALLILIDGHKQCHAEVGAT